MNAPWDRLQDGLRRFSALTADEAALLQPAVSTVHLARGERFATEGKRAFQVGLLLSGALRHFYTHDGVERTTYFYFEDHFVGDYFSCITGKPSQLTIEALTDATLLVFPYSALAQLFERSHAWERFGRRLAEYLALGLEERLVTLLTLQPEARYRHLLGSGKDKILERIPQQYIASYLGVSPVSLSRIRARLARR